MGIYQQLRKNWQDGSTPESIHAQLVQWRKQPSTLRLERPTRLDRARALGYRAIPGVFIVRERILRGGHQRTRPMGRRSKTKTSRMNLVKNYQLLCEERVARTYHNCEIVNSYYVAQDGQHYWYEVIVADRSHPQIASDPRYAMTTRQGRVFRGLTSAGLKIRGLMHKGTGAEKARGMDNVKNRSRGAKYAKRRI